MDGVPVMSFRFNIQFWDSDLGFKFRIQVS